MSATIHSDITILDNILAVNLLVSLWSARRKMNPEDFGGVELPPDDLATLGSKRIADPVKLRIFNTLKARAFNFLDKHGVRFMSGWAIPDQKAGLVTSELENIRDEFFAAKDAFLAEYDNHLNAWIARHTDWAAIIRDSVVSSDYVDKRMDFRWQIYKVEPLMQHEDQNAVIKAGLAEEVESLAMTLFGEISRSADEIWKKVYLGKTEVTHKALSPLRSLRDKLAGLSFVEPHVAPVAEIIQTALDNVPGKGNITGVELCMLQGLVCLLRDTDNLLIHSQRLLEGKQAVQIVQGLAGTDACETGDEVLLPLPEDMPVLAELPVAPVKPVLPNMGLW